MYQQRIRCNPSWYGHLCHNTVFVVQDEDQAGMEGLLVAQVHIFFSIVDEYDRETVPCALVSWFISDQDYHDPNTHMWTVRPEGTHRQ